MIVLTTPVYLTEEDAKKFLLFQKYYNMFKKLDETRALDIQFGKLTLNIANSEVQSVTREEVVYHK